MQGLRGGIAGVSRPDAPDLPDVTEVTDRAPSIYSGYPLVGVADAASEGTLYFGRNEEPDHARTITRIHLARAHDCNGSPGDSRRPRDSGVHEHRAEQSDSRAKRQSGSGAQSRTQRSLERGVRVSVCAAATNDACAATPAWDGGWIVFADDFCAAGVVDVNDRPIELARQDQRRSDHDRRACDKLHTDGTCRISPDIFRVEGRMFGDQRARSASPFRGESD